MLEGWVCEFMIGSAIIQHLSLERNEGKRVWLQLDFVRPTGLFGKELLA